MAKKVANGLNKRQPKRREVEIDSDSDFSSQSEGRGSNFSSGISGRQDYQQLVRELISNPMVKYIAGGIATSILTRLATNMADKYPELSRFLKENIDSFEGRLGQYRPQMDRDQESRA